MKITPYQDVRKKIWNKLGNKCGKDTFLNNNIILVDSSELETNVFLEDRVALAPYVTFITCSSPNDSILAKEEYTKKYIKMGSIYIGEDSWIGTHTVIHPGVHIGKRCIIGSCSNVTKDIPDDSLAFGNPAKIIRRLKE